MDLHQTKFEKDALKAYFEDPYTSSSEDEGEASIMANDVACEGGS
jgi:hypothetical protein